MILPICAPSLDLIKIINSAPSFKFLTPFPRNQQKKLIHVQQKYLIFLNNETHAVQSNTNGIKNILQITICIDARRYHFYKFIPRTAYYHPL